jgi:hypothetical protein
MMEKPQPDPPPDPVVPDSPVEPLQIDTPVIDIQDVEHKPGPLTRVSNKGVKVEPTISDADARDLAKEDEKALEALEELEKSIARQPPG